MKHFALPLFCLFAANAATAGNVDIVHLDGFESEFGNLIYSEPFALDQASPWPFAWTVLGNVAVADIAQQQVRSRTTAPISAHTLVDNIDLPLPPLKVPEHASLLVF